MRVGIIDVIDLYITIFIKCIECYKRYSISYIFYLLPPLYLESLNDQQRELRELFGVDKTKLDVLNIGASK